MYSWDDYISEHRWHIISTSPRTTDFDVRQCFALSDENSHTSTEQLTERITASITEHQPEVLLVHTGAAFKRQPEIFISALTQIHETYPPLRLGFEPDPRYLEICLTSGLFEDSEDMRRIEELFFFRVFSKYGGP
jgi:hypothetical protein